MYLRQGVEDALCQGKEMTSVRDSNNDQMASCLPMIVILTVLMLHCADHGGDIQWMGIRHDCNNAMVRTLVALS